MRRLLSVSLGQGVRSIIWNALHLLGIQGLSQGIRFVYTLVLARYLGPELYGLLTYGQAWYLALLPFTDLGLGIMLSREVGRRSPQSVALVDQTFTLRSLAAGVVATVCGLVGWLSEGAPETRLLLLVFSGALFGRSLAMWTEVVFVAYEAAHYSLRQYVLLRPLEVLIGLGLLAAGYGLVAIASVHAVSWWLQSLYGLSLIRRRLVPVQYRWQWRPLVRLLIQGVPIGGGVFLVGWFQQGPLVLFRHVAGDQSSLGQFALAMQCFILLSTAASTVSRVALPVLSRSVARQDGKERVFAKNMLLGGLLFGVIAGVGGMTLGPAVVDMFFGASYGKAGKLVGLTLWLLVPWIWGNTLWQVMLAQGRMLAASLSAVAGALVFTGTFSLLFSRFGSAGALLATGLGMSIWAVSQLALLSKPTAYPLSAHLHDHDSHQTH